VDISGGGKPSACNFQTNGNFDCDGNFVWGLDNHSQG
jgi:polygalacturonase